MGFGGRQFRHECTCRDKNYRFVIPNPQAPLMRGGGKSGVETVITVDSSQAYPCQLTIFPPPHR